MESLGVTFAPGVARNPKTNNAMLSALLLVLWMMTFIVVGILVVYARSVFTSGRLPFLKPSRGYATQKNEGSRSSRRKLLPFQFKRAKAYGTAMVVRRRRRDDAAAAAGLAAAPRKIGGRFSSMLAAGRRGTDPIQEDNQHVVSGRSDSFDDTVHIPQICRQLLQTTAPKSLQPIVTKTQLETQQHCRELLLELQRLKLRLGPDVNTSPQTGTNQETFNSCKAGLKRVRALFEGFKTRYAADRLGYTRVMILCCNVIMALDALPLLKSLQGLDEEAAEDAQWVIGESRRAARHGRPQ